MRRGVVALAGVAIATALIFGPGRAYLPGSARVQLGGVPQAAAEPAHTGTEHGAPPAPAAAVPNANAARLSLSARPAAKLEKGYVLSAHVAAPDGKPVNETSVDFLETVDLFGQREMLIGEARTDGAGDAELVYLPARLGTHDIVVRSASKGQVRGGEGRFTLDAQVAAPLYRREPAPLAAFSAAVPYAAGTIVISVWLLLAFALLGTARGVLGDARDHAQKKGDIA